MSSRQATNAAVFLTITFLFPSRRIALRLQVFVSLMFLPDLSIWPRMSLSYHF